MTILELTRDMQVGKAEALDACIALFRERERAKAVCASRNRRAAQYQFHNGRK
ncbi:MAG TPA: hypothetical protein VFI87_06345 [Hyphomicrobiaceae bacterium]|nr:hypothetical protein [Hyphomicrobiaceae bacterium]